MALSLRKNNSRGPIGLDIDGRFLAAVQAEDGRLVHASSMELPEGLLRDGEVAEADGLAEALKEFAARTGIPKKVRLGVANQQIVVRLVELPRIENAAEREAAIRFQAAEAIAMPLDDAVLDHQVASVSDAPDGSSRMQVVLVAARRAMIDSYIEVVKKAGLRPESIDLDAFALVRVLARNTPAADSARVLCHLAGVANLAIAVGDSCLFTRPLSTDWNDAQAASRLADEIRLSIDYYMAQPNALPASDVMLSGPGSHDDQLVAELASYLGLETRVAQPLGGIEASAMPAGEDPHRYTVATGLALGAAA
jgi:type IV pilus assembly protein PilM